MISGLGAAQAGFRLLGCLSRGSGICDDSRSWRLPGWTEPSGLTWLQPDSLGSSIFNDFFGLGVSRAGFRFLGCLSRGSGQIRSDRPFSIGFRLLGCLLRGSGQTRSDRTFSNISGLDTSRAGLRLLGYLSRGSGQTCSDHQFSMISGLGD